MTTVGPGLPERVAAEIRSLRKGRGLQASGLESRLGPLMSELAGNGDAAARRQALLTEVNRCSEELLDDIAPPSRPVWRCQRRRCRSLTSVRE